MPSRKLALSLAAVLSMLYLLLRPIPISRLQSAQEAENLGEQLRRHFPYNPESRLPKYVWQTWKYSPSPEESAESSWALLNPDFEHQVLTDDAAELLIAQLFEHVAKVRQAYQTLPEPVLKADFFRYLILLARGGIYSDIDTIALKPAADWIPAEINMRNYGLAVGIEADPDRPDWHDWYSRRIQFCQWTILSKPGHPVLVDIVVSITIETLARKEHGQLSRGSYEIMEYTGPGIWTDTLFNFFNNPRYPVLKNASINVTWERFANLTHPVKEGDVVVLPITSFSPGIGHMGAGSSDDPIAYVKHAFSGSWKDDKRR